MEGGSSVTSVIVVLWDTLLLTLTLTAGNANWYKREAVQCTQCNINLWQDEPYSISRHKKECKYPRLTDVKLSQ